MKVADLLVMTRKIVIVQYDKFMMFLIWGGGRPNKVLFERIVYRKTLRVNYISFLREIKKAKHSYNIYRTMFVTT